MLLSAVQILEKVLVEIVQMTREGEKEKWKECPAQQWRRQETDTALCCNGAFLLVNASSYRSGSMNESERA